MLASQVADVRRFNRVVTQRVGALHDQYLGRSRSLGESRVLWEAGKGEPEVRELRARLDLDSGYLSRLLRSLEKAGLLEVVPMGSDRRVRVVRLTPAGRAERTLIDRRSDALAEAVLDPLDERQREALTTAMAQVERLLMPASVEIGPADPASAAARTCLAAYFAELDERFEAGFDPHGSLPAEDDELRPPHGVLLVASLQARPIGCGALKLHPDGVVEVKRMWVSDDARGLGLGRRLLRELENYAAEHGGRLLRLETNRSLVEAIALYRSLGYIEMPAFNNEAYADHWFEKPLSSS